MFRCPGQQATASNYFKCKASLSTPIVDLQRGWRGKENTSPVEQQVVFKPGIFGP